GADEGTDAIELLVTDAWIPAAHALDEIVGRQRSLQVDDLEQAVDGVADLGCREPRRARCRTTLVGRTHAYDPLGVVAVRTALEQRQRAERQSANPMKRRRRHVGQWLQRRDERRQHSVAAFLEEQELSFLGGGLRRRVGLF